MRSILIVGSYGFLGSHVTRSFSQANYKIILLVRKNSKPHRISDSIISKAKIYYYEETNLDHIFLNHQIFITVFAAVKYESNFKYLIYETNLLLPIKIIEIGQINGCKNYIFFGSFFQKFPEYTAKPDYTLSKSFFNKIAMQNDNVRIFNLQLEHMYGPNDMPYKFIPRVLDDLVNEIPQINLTRCIQKRDFIYVEDVVSLICEIADKCEEFSDGYRLLEVGTGVSVEISTFLNLLKEKLNSTSLLNYGAIPMSNNEILDSFAQRSSIPKDLSWHPKYTLVEGIEQILAQVN